MTKKIFAAAIFFLLFNTYSSFAQSKDETAVATAVENLRKAMVDGDRAALDKCTAPELSYGHSGGTVETKEEFIDGITSGRSDFVTIDLTNQTIKVVGDVGIVRHVLTAKTNDNGKPGNVKLAILTIWQKRGGQWKLLARQAVHAN
jgi:ketosteroid isomerase-like protein